MPFLWICPKCGYVVITKRLSEAYDKAQLHIIFSHHEGFSAKRINRFTIDLGDYGVISFINDPVVYQLYNNPLTHKQLITYMRENHLLRSKI